MLRTVLFFVLLSSIPAMAQFANTAFYKNRAPLLSFTTSNQTISAGFCSGLTTIQTRSTGNVAINVSSNLTVNLSGPSGVSFYSDSECTQPISSVTIASGTSSANFYFQANNSGTPTITALATGYGAGNQTETINAYGFIWTGNGGNSNWNTAGNWSGGVVPGSSNIAVFNNSCTANCSPNINTNVNIAGLRMNSGYTGTITQNSGFTITTGTSMWTQIAGNFVGSSSGDAITVYSRLSISGGSFKSTSGTLTVQLNGPYGAADFKLGSSGTFLANTGTLLIDGGCATTNLTFGSATYNNLTIQSSGGCSTFAISDTNVTIAGNLTLKYTSIDGNINGGTLSVGGNVTTTGTNVWGGSAIVKLTGNPLGQTITSNSNGSVPNLIIDAGTNPVTIAGTLVLPGNYTYSSSGTFTTTGSTLHFSVNCATYYITPGTVAYNNVKFSAACSNFNFGNGTMTINGDLTLTHPSYGSTLSNGTLNVAGNVNTTGPNLWNGSAVIRLVGRVSGQIVTSTGSGGLPNLIIDVGANPVTIAGSLAVASYTMTSVSTLVTTGSTLRILGPTAKVGTETYNNVTFGGSCAAITLTGTMKIDGNVSFYDGCYGRLDGGTLAVAGNINVSNWAGGSTNLTLNGSSQQTYSQTTGYPPEGAVTLNNAAGLLFSTNATFNSSSQTFTVTNGNMDLNGKSLSVKALSLNSFTVTRNGGTLTVNGSVVPAGTQSLYGGTIQP